MSEVLYRKWRPKRLDQVVGQEPVVQTLRQAVALARVAHAYLFCGPRGTGKTSTARILAKAVNCLSPLPEGEPDNECAMCRGINEGRALDLIEIDAASNRGIDDIRALRDKIHFAPNEARYKVYIVDEAHMLTPPAFNALLKTLEEPPRHAIFVLATTEAHKLPLTIISRCQRFDFRRISPEAMVRRLQELCDDEKASVEAQALLLIARMATGSLRDAENLLEQVLVSYGPQVTEAQVRDLLELGSDEVTLTLVEHVANGKVHEGLALISDISGKGVDLRRLHRGVMDCLRGVLLAATGNERNLGYPEEVAVRLKSVASALPMERLVHTLKTFSQVDLRQDVLSPLPLELALLEACLEPRSQTSAEARVASAEPVRPDGPARAPEERRRAAPRAAPRQAAAPTGPAPSVRPAAPTGPPDEEPRPVGPQAEGVPSGPPSRLDVEWNSLLRSLRGRRGKKYNLGAVLRASTRREVEEGRISLVYIHRSHMERMQEELDDPPTLRLLREAFAAVMGAQHDLAVVLEDRTDHGGKAAAQRSPLVRVAMAMGAEVTGEEEHADE